MIINEIKSKKSIFINEVNDIILFKKKLYTYDFYDYYERIINNANFPINKLKKNFNSIDWFYFFYSYKLKFISIIFVS